jgi:PAS domain S-box-containing protein
LTASNDIAFLTGGGQTGALIRAFDWASTSLGAIQSWPQSLKTATATLVHSTVPIVMLWGEDGVMIYNDAYSVFAGGRHPGLLGRKVREAWVEVADFNDHVMKVGLAGGTLAYRDQELTLSRRGPPEQVWMNLDYSPVFDETGKPAGVMAIVVETTERVLADRRIAAERDRLKRMFEQAPGFMAMLDGPDHVVSLTNPAYMQLIGPRRVIGLKLREALPEVEGQGYFEILDECFRTGQPYVGTGVKLLVQRIAGSPPEELFVDFVYQPIADADGRVSGVFVQGSDVTARVAADIAHRESEARFREAADAAPVLIWVSDTEGSAIWFNKPWRDFAGAPMEQDLGRGWTQRIHPDDAGTLLAINNEAYRRRAPFRTDVRLRRHDGEYRVFDNTGVPRFAANGRFLGYIGSCVDVTEARRAEASLRRLTETLEARVEARTSELAAANRLLIAQIEERERMETTLRRMQRLEAVGQLTAGVAHDFNNLLTVVLGNIGFLERALHHVAVDARTRDRLGYMKIAAERGATLTGQLLAFSRRQRLEARPVNLNETVVSMRDLLQSSMGGSVRLQTVLHPDLWPALVDATQIELVILNLAINARDAMQVGGALTVQTANVTLGEPERLEDPPPGDYVVVSVADTGSGMTPEVLAKAFEPFFTTKETGRGTGLGLSIVYGIANRWGGHVSVSTEVGVGSTFTLLFPVSTEAPDPSVTTPTTSRPDGGHQSILLVEDEDGVRRSTTRILEVAGYRVLQAENGVEASRVFDAETVDILVTDLVMPGGVSGQALAESVRGRNPLLPVVFVSGYSQETIAEKGVFPPSTAIVKKPFLPSELLEAIARAIAERAPAVR